MSYSSDLSQSQEYLSFRSSVPLRKIVVDSEGSKVNTKLHLYNVLCCLISIIFKLYENLHYNFRVGEFMIVVRKR